MTAFAHLRRGAKRARSIFQSHQHVWGRRWVAECRQCPFVPERVLVLTKISRYQIEKQVSPHLNEDRLKSRLIAIGADYDAILSGHLRNKDTLMRTLEALQRLNIECRIRDRYNIDDESVAWADLILSVGGDGTFLQAANLIADKSKPIIGINSDPEYSEGFLILSAKYTNDISKIFERLGAGEFKYLMRSRIRTTLYGDNIWEVPFHLHAHRSLNKSKTFYQSHYEATKPKGSELPKERPLPWLALNEVFIGECLSARMSTLYVNIDKDKGFKRVKSSGMCVTTGTGSTSWYRTINYLNPQMVKDVLSMVKYDKALSHEEIKKICFDFNTGLQYSAEELKLAYVIRDMVVKHIWPLPTHINYRGFCDELTVRSQCYEGGLVIDGGVVAHFNLGTTAILQCLEDDQLCSIIFPD
ncbi:PREDICTED: NAD kinase 2, mitochondrial [Ceratosolen solmsi marchali]|uniref:NAD(+) kinase n=1 Tax=Ceratosolen solmsi marchali TaxID=326594 RepID=A0AAJ6YMZ7_9HYME|nr:PREDICTED: NAD kinase 2, mitochondrial [Ceratosolen solmsi marchali]